MGLDCVGSRDQSGLALCDRSAPPRGEGARRSIGRRVEIGGIGIGRMGKTAPAAGLRTASMACAARPSPLIVMVT